LEATQRNPELRYATARDMCSLFHGLGHTLMIHYLHDEFLAIQRTTIKQDIDQLTASRKILDIAYHELGAAVAKTWKLPRLLAACMRPLNRGDLTPLGSTARRIHFFTAFASTVARMLVGTDPRELAERMHGLLARCAPAVPIEHDALRDACASAAELTARYSRLLKHSVDTRVRRPTSRSRRRSTTRYPQCHRRVSPALDPTRFRVFGRSPSPA
jgi:hypothetical protein